MVTPLADMPEISFAEQWSGSSSVDPLNSGSNRELDIPFPITSSNVNPPLKLSFQGPGRTNIKRGRGPWEITAPLPHVFSQLEMKTQLHKLSLGKKSGTPLLSRGR